MDEAEPSLHIPFFKMVHILIGANYKKQLKNKEVFFLFSIKCPNHLSAGWVSCFPSSPDAYLLESSFDYFSDTEILLLLSVSISMNIL